ncbi:MAG: hypothetical protein E7168_04520 [Firmicutes bacterium]|nr:hypothetical protein [Bacillota bacterium]
MKKLNKKGLTIIETVVTFALIMFIVAGLLTIIMNYRHRLNTDIKFLDLTTYKNTLTKDIQDDIMTKGINTINSEGECVTEADKFNSCINFVFKDGTERILAVSKIDYNDKTSVSNKYIRYGITEYPLKDTLPESIPSERKPGDFQSIFVSDNNILSIDSTTLDDGTMIKIYSIDIYIEHIDYDADFGIHIVATDSDSLSTNALVKDFYYTGDYQTYTIPATGTYKIELWGASGGDIGPYKGGAGGYTSGYIHLSQGQRLQIYVGGQGSQSATGGWNGGASLSHDGVSGASGGGATDIRITPGSWADFDSLKSRIMVAGGGGGANYRNHTSSTDLTLYGSGNGGAGGCLNGNNSDCAGTAEQYKATAGYTTANVHDIGTGGKQNAGGDSVKINSADEVLSTSRTGQYGYSAYIYQSGAGAGWYSGGNSLHAGAGGGSSYISGHNGCLAIDQSSTASSITHKTTSEYSSYVFSNTTMIDGNGYEWTTTRSYSRTVMPSNGVNTIEYGNIGHGHAKITYLGL